MLPTFARYYLPDDLEVEEVDRSRRFMKRPVTIDAIQFTGDNCIACLRFIHGKDSHYFINSEIQDTDSPVIETPEGQMTASPGDWIIRGVKGEFYPIKDEILRMSYDPVDASWENM